jgi:hypothetical protein
LHAVVSQAKGGDPLAPVTILVPTNSVGVSARRLLASGELGALTEAGAGIAGVGFLTVLRLAEQLAAPRLAEAGRRPVSTPVVASAVRAVLATNPGLFASVAHHAATEEALVAAHRELADLDDAQLDILSAQHARAHDVVRIHRAVRRRLEDQWYAEHDLMALATEVVGERRALIDNLGTVVCYLPQRWSAPAARLVRALGEAGRVIVIAGVTGVAQADAASFATLGRVGAKLDEELVAGIVPTRPARVFNASDPDDEVRAIVRQVIDALREGVPLERMAILFGSADPYARLVHEHLTLAGVPHNGAATRTLADCLVGRTLLRLLALPDNDFRRDDVCALFATAPLLDGRGNRVPGVAWERVARNAGVVGGAYEWDARLKVYADGEPHDQARANELRAFMRTLVAELHGGEESKSWRELAHWAHGMIGAFVGGEEHRGHWPDFEQDAARRVEAALDRLRGLDTVEGATSAAVFRRSLEIELRAARVRLAHLGEGVLTGPPAFALGVELERLWVCGLAEGLFPAAAHDDPLLGDRERASLDGELMLRAERADDDHRALLAALASTTGRRTLSWPRGDLRRSTEHVPSRFLDAPNSVDTIASYVDALTRVEFPASRQELGVRAALGPNPWITAMPEVMRNRELIAARASKEFTRFDGNVGVHAQLRIRDANRPVSATRLEQWVRCPHAYFVRYVLHVEPVVRPEDIFQLTPLDRGSLVHEILERFFRDGPINRERLQSITDELCKDAEARGITGRRLLWNRDQRLLHAELDAFFAADAEYRGARGIDTLSTESAFGDVARMLDDGSTILLRGKIDRVDRTRDGSLVVIDYKTGKPDDYLGLSSDDPIAGGELLQLPVYAFAAAAAYETSSAGVEVAYWFVGRGEDRRIGYIVDENVEAEFDDAVHTIVDGIESGCFVANPPAPSPRPFVLCPYCDPDGVGTGERYRETERKWDSPELETFRSLHEVERGLSGPARPRQERRS